MIKLIIAIACFALAAILMLTAKFLKETTSRICRRCYREVPLHQYLGDDQICFDCKMREKYSGNAGEQPDAPALESGVDKADQEL